MSLVQKEYQARKSNLMARIHPVVKSVSLCAFVWSIFLLQASADNADEPAISLAETKIMLEKRADHYEGWLVLKGNQNIKNADTLKVENVASGAKIKISFPESGAKYIDSISSGHAWKLKIRANGIAGGETVNRQLLVKDPGGGSSYLLSYSVVAHKPTALLWEVLPASIVWRPSRLNEFGISVNVDNEPLPDFALANASLVRNDGSVQLTAEDFNVCLGSCGGTSLDPLALRADQTHQIGLILAPNVVPVGNFKGKMSFVAGDGSAAMIIDVDLAQRGEDAIFLGLAAIVAGILIAIFINVFLYGGLTRLYAKEPAVRMRRIVAKLGKRTKEAAVLFGEPNPLKSLDTIIARTREELETSYLDGELYLPRVYRAGFVPKTQKYQSHLDAKRADIERINLIFESSIDYMASQWAIKPDSDKPDLRTIVEKTASEVNTADVATIKTNLASHNTEFDQIGGRRKGVAAAGGSVIGAALSVFSLNVKIAAMGWVLFGIWASLTFAAGWYVLIESNPGFGIPRDYLRAFLWGAGVPVIGPALQQLTPKNIASSFQVLVPGVKK